MWGLAVYSNKFVRDVRSQENRTEKICNTMTGGVFMSRKKNQYSKRRDDTSINPQGLSEDAEDQQPKSQLEQRAKKKNTKI